jgi:hypothetical protein
VFAAFFISRVEGYRQLALLANLSIFICLFFAIFILPYLIGGDRPAQTTLRYQFNFSEFSLPVSDTFRIVLGGLLILLFVALGPRLSFDDDITQYDATEKSILAAEADLHRTLGAATAPSILVVSGDTLEESLRANDAIYEQVTNAIGQNNFSSLSPLWPSKARREANRKRWEEFWNPAREAQLRTMLTEYGQQYHFSEDAFSPFLNNLHNTGALEDWPSDSPFFEQLKERFVLKADNKYQILSFFPDRPEYIARLQSIADSYPQSLVVGRKYFSGTVAHAAISELLRVSLIGILATILLTWWLLKSLRLMFLALLPVLMSLVAILGVLSATGHALNITAIIASLVVIGIVSDYGMFVVYYCQNQSKTGTCAAVTLAAITTLIGSAVLLFAIHPMLFSVGLVMTTGVLSGAVFSLLVIPPIYRKMCGESLSSAGDTVKHE